MKALLLTLLIICSCSKKATITRDAFGIQIHPVLMEVTHLNEIEWSIGLKKEKKVTQSFTFIVDMPNIDQDDLEYLYEQRGIDSWILRLITYRGSETQDLGSLYAKFKPNKISRGSQTTGAPKSVTFKVYYAAAFASMQFRAFKCPAFGHNKKIRSMKVAGPNDVFSLSVGQIVPYNEKSHQVELTPSAFNGGNDLTGEYYIEIAPYNSVKRQIHSSFKRLPMHISVNSEESIRVSSCDGIHQEFK